MPLDYSVDVRVRLGQEPSLLGFLIEKSDHQLAVYEEISLDAGQTPVEVTMAWDKTLAHLIWFMADVDVDLLFNSSSAPDVTINLKAGKPYLWERTYHAEWLENVVTLFVIPHATKDCVLQGRISYDG